MTTSSRGMPVLSQTGAYSLYPSGTRMRRRRSDWRLGGRAVRRWDRRTLLSAAVVAGVAVLGSLLIFRFAGTPENLLASAVLWGGLFTASAIAVVRSRPAGLFQFRAHEVVWGLALGLALRWVQGLLSDADESAFPASALLLQSGASRWLLEEGIPLGIMGPLAEELFFRAVLLVSVYQLFRRSLGVVSAGVTASFTSAGGFVLLHGAFSPLGLAEGLQLFLLGLTCAALVLCTGRFWGAVLVHVVYNLTFLVLALAGSMLA